MKITTKIAKNGVKLYYVDGKRVGKAAAMEIAANLDRQIMSGLFEQTNTDNVKACVTAQFNTTLGEALIDNFYFDSKGAAIDAANKILATFAGRIISIRVSDNGSWNNCKIFAASNNGNSLTFYNYSDEIQATITKFEEGKTYYRIWDEDTGRPHMSHFTITKRTAKTVVLKNGYRCRIFVNDNGVEVFKAGYGTYVYADNLCTVEAEKRQANSDAAWDKMEADAQRRMLELKAAEAERYEIMSTPLTTQDALEVAVRAEIQNANNVKINDLKWEIRYTEGSINDLDKNHIAHFPNDQSLQKRRAELVNELAALNSQLAEIEPANTHEPDHITGTGLKEENVMTIKKQAGFLADKIKRECASIDGSTTDLDQLNDIDDEIVTPVENRHKLIGKWNETLFAPEFKHGTAKMIFTMQGLMHQAKIVWSYISVGFDKGKYKFRMGNLLLGKYDTPAQVEKVIDLLKVAITRGDKAFTFPTVEELDPNPDDELIDPPAETLNHKQKKNLRGSINRAVKQCIRNRIGYLKSHNSKMEKYEYELLCLLQGARRELEIA